MALVVGLHLGPHRPRLRGAVEDRLHFGPLGLPGPCRLQVRRHRLLRRVFLHDLQLLVVLGAGAVVVQQSVGVVEEDAHLLAVGARDVGVADLLQVVVGLLNLGFFGVVVDAQQLVEIAGRLLPFHELPRLRAVPEAPARHRPAAAFTRRRAAPRRGSRERSSGHRSACQKEALGPLEAGRLQFRGKATGHAAPARGAVESCRRGRPKRRTHRRASGSRGSRGGHRAPKHTGLRHWAPPPAPRGRGSGESRPHSVCRKPAEAVETGPTNLEAEMAT
mmetsp:Transcript_98811/g.318635  ORF Transcript_98811/g.318635 Transcript_98811/m.318635 type:complete len:276 (+) Transcript_98811:764-1591(+)